MWEGGGSIDDSMIESQSLAFMDRDCPGCFQRILTESSGNRLCDLFGLGIDRIFDVAPGLFFNLYLVPVFSDNGDFVRVDENDLTDFYILI